MLQSKETLAKVQGQEQRNAEQRNAVQEEGKVSVQEEGKPQDAEAKKQVSSQEQTSDPDGVIVLDPTKSYRHARRPEESISGDEMYTGFQRGQGYSKMESDLQKLQAAQEKTTEETESLRKQVADYESKERLLDNMKELGLDKQVRQPQPSEDILFGEESAQPQPVDTDTLAKQFREIARAEVGEQFGKAELPAAIEDLIDKRVGEIYSTEKQTQEAQARQLAAVNKIKAARLASLIAENPDADENELKAIAGADDLALGKFLEMIELSNTGDTYGAMEKLLDGMETQKTGRDGQLKVMQQQAVINAQREKDAEIEALSGGGKPLVEEEGLKPEYDYRKAQANRETRLAKAKELVTKRQALKSTGIDQQ